jgi:hypothetical protein
MVFWKDDDELSKSIKTKDFFTTLVTAVLDIHGGGKPAQRETCRFWKNICSTVNGRHLFSFQVFSIFLCISFSYHTP